MRTSEATLITMGAYPMDWAAVIDALTTQADLSASQSEWLIREILEDRLTDAQVGSALACLHVKGETATEVTAMVAALADHARPLRLAGNFIDVCGTGGTAPRRSAALNVSTLASLVLAAGGVRVCKFGGRATSSTSGSADLLAALRVPIEMEAHEIKTCLAEFNWAFCLSPLYHPRLLRVKRIRHELTMPTVFNLVLSLSHPGHPTHRVLGVGTERLLPIMADALVSMGVASAMVVTGDGGIDELTTAGPNQVIELRNGERNSYVLEPSTIGLPRVAPSELTGGDARRNCAIAETVFAGQRSPYADVVVLNAAAGFFTWRTVDSLEEGVKYARDVVMSGAVGDLVARLRQRHSS